MNVHGTTVTDIVFSAMEFHDLLCVHLNVNPINPQSHCDRCGIAFEVHHTLRCITGGLVIARHNEVCDKILYLSHRSFNSESVHVEPLIHQGHTRSERETHQGSDKDKETRGDVTILGL